MIEYIRGEVTEANPAYVVLETSGIGYFINISLNTFTSVKVSEKLKLYIYEVIREDPHSLYGFIGEGNMGIVYIKYLKYWHY